jgi:hypothetical protein
MLDAVGASRSKASMRAGLNAAARRPRLGFTPSIQMVSELTWKNGPRQQRQRLDHAATGAEKLVALVGDHDARPLACGEVALDLVGEVVDVDDRALDPLLGEAIEHVVDQRLAADRDQRLGMRPLNGAHARAESGREHHRALRWGRDWRQSGPLNRFCLWGA